MTNSDKENIMTRNEIVNALSTKDCRVVFTKTNGEQREMFCTLRDSVLPTTSTSATTSSVNESVVSAWDVKNSGWRSFRMDSIISFE